MTDTPSAYMVAAIFGAAPTTRLCLNAVVAPTPEAAVAIAITAFVQQLGITEPIQGVNVQKLEAAFMRAALNGGDGKVVPLSVVPQAAPEQPVEAARLDCPIHGEVVVTDGPNVCPQCRENARSGWGPWSGLAFGKKPFPGGAQHPPGSTPTG